MEKLNTKHKRESRQSNEEKYDISGQLSSFRRIFTWNHQSKRKQLLYRTRPRRKLAQKMTAAGKCVVLVFFMISRLFSCNTFFLFNSPVIFVHVVKYMLEKSRLCVYRGCLKFFLHYPLLQSS